MQLVWTMVHCFGCCLAVLKEPEWLAFVMYTYGVSGSRFFNVAVPTQSVSSERPLMMMDFESPGVAKSGLALISTIGESGARMTMLAELKVVYPMRENDSP